MSIGQNIRRARQDAGMTIQQATARLVDYGIDLATCTLSALERGERRLAAETVEALAEIYGCTIDSLYGHTGTVTLDLTDHELEIIRYIRSGWQGDHHALIELLGLYAACDPAHRAAMASAALEAFTASDPQAPYTVNTDLIRLRKEELL